MFLLPPQIFFYCVLSNKFVSGFRYYFALDSIILIKFVLQSARLYNAICMYVSLIRKRKRNPKPFCVQWRVAEKILGPLLWTLVIVYGFLNISLLFTASIPFQFPIVDPPSIARVPITVYHSKSFESTQQQYYYF